MSKERIYTARRKRRNLGKGLGKALALTPVTPAAVPFPPCTASIVGSGATEVEVEEGLTKDVTMVSNSVMVASSVMICRSSEASETGAEVMAGLGVEAVELVATTSVELGEEVEVGVGAEVDGVMTEDLNE